VDLALAGAANAHFTAVGISWCAGPMPGAGGGYRTVIVADSSSQRVTIQFAIFASDYHGPGTYPEYKDVFNGGGEGLTVLIEPGNYFASVLPGDSQGTFTINSDGSSGTVSAVNLHGNNGGKVSLTGSWRCR
jgi:hypothetical protein